jgi:hypothetical protein
MLRLSVVLLFVFPSPSATAFLFPTGKFCATKWNSKVAPIAALADDSLADPELMIARETTAEVAAQWLFPPVTSVLSFMTYSDVSHAFRNTIDVVSGRSWNAADGGQLLAQIITPAVNGIIMTTIGILFATIVAMTISTLYQRQLNLHKTFSKEVNELHRLSFLLASLPDPYRLEAKTIMDEYVLYSYSFLDDRNINADLVRQKNFDNLYLLLIRLSEDTHADPTLASSTIISYSLDSLFRVEDEKTTFITLLQSVFPPMHYINLALLAFSICTVYLLETDQDVILFLAAFQLKFLWAILTGCFATIATIIYDLSNPFGGSYSVSSHLCVRQYDVDML